MPFQLRSEFEPQGDQPAAIESLVKGLDSGSQHIGLVESGALAPADFPLLRSARPSRTTVMVDYSLSEFSRFRLQLGADRSNPAAIDRQIFLQYIMSLGAHGAHKF